MSRTLTPEHKNRLQDGRKRAAEERARQEAEERQNSLRHEWATIDERLARVEKAYDEAWTRAIRAPYATMDAAFDIAARRQSQFVNLLARKRHLAQELGLPAV